MDSLDRKSMIAIVIALAFLWCAFFLVGESEAQPTFYFPFGHAQPVDAKYSAEKSIGDATAQYLWVEQESQTENDKSTVSRTTTANAQTLNVTGTATIDTIVLTNLKNDTATFDALYARLLSATSVIIIGDAVIDKIKLENIDATGTIKIPTSVVALGLAQTLNVTGTSSMDTSTSGTANSQTHNVTGSSSITIADITTLLNDTGTFGIFAGETLSATGDSTLTNAIITTAKTTTSTDGTANAQNSYVTGTAKLHASVIESASVNVLYATGSGDSYFTGELGVGLPNPSALMELREVDDATDAVTNVLKVTSRPNGTASDGHGARIILGGENSNDNAHSIAAIDAILIDVTAGTEDGALTFSTVEAGAEPAERMRIANDGNVTVATPSTTARMEIADDGVGADVVLRTVADDGAVYNFVHGRADVDSTSNQGLRGYLTADGTAVVENSEGHIALNDFVGVGTSIPSGARLEVEDGEAPSGPLFKITADDQLPWAMTIGNDTYAATDSWGLGFWTGNDGKAHIQAGGGATTKTDLILQESGGDVGIGTDSPGYTDFSTGTKVSINTSSAPPTLELAHSENSTGGVGVINFINTENSSSTWNAAGAKNIAIILGRAVTSDANAGDDSGGLIAFYTKPEAGIITETMRIDENGNVGIGTTAPGQTLEVSGQLEIRRDGAAPLLKFTDAGVNSRWIGIVDGDNSFNVYGTNGTTRELILDADGDLLIGGGTTQQATYDLTLTNSGYAYSAGWHTPCTLETKEVVGEAKDADKKSEWDKLIAAKGKLIRKKAPHEISGATLKKEADFADKPLKYLVNYNRIVGTTKVVNVPTIVDTTKMIQVPTIATVMESIPKTRIETDTIIVDVTTQIVSATEVKTVTTIDFATREVAYTLEQASTYIVPVTKTKISMIVVSATQLEEVKEDYLDYEVRNVTEEILVDTIIPATKIVDVPTVVADTKIVPATEEVDAEDLTEFEADNDVIQTIVRTVVSAKEQADAHNAPILDELANPFYQKSRNMMTLEDLPDDVKADDKTLALELAVLKLFEMNAELMDMNRKQQAEIDDLKSRVAVLEAQ